ncbi:MAG: hypothetical protein LAT50_20270 [Ectothiorhodospiraceae bacterium]|nr:hypothetical protein [Ectothiorhodospiraceae bacterium]
MSTDYDQQRRRLHKCFSQDGLVGADDQTRITLFIQSLKAINSGILAKLEFQPLDWAPWKFLHTQYYRELEMATLMGRATSWSTNPVVYLEASNLNLGLWNRTQAWDYLQAPLAADERFYRYLAMSHALLSVVRLIPLLPPSMPLDTPFLQALHDVEEENGRQIQLQIRLLKELDMGMDRKQREALVEEEGERVEASYLELLASLCPEQAEQG